MRVAIQGQPGSFSEAAAQLLAPDAEIVNCANFDDLFRAVSSGRAMRGVVPVHNSIVGAIYDNAERTLAPTFRRCADMVLPVRQCLITRPGVDVASVRRVASHPVALRQCTRFFAADARRIPVEIADTGSAVRDLMRGTLPADAAIASAAAAARYGAVVTIEGIDDDPANATAFVLFECAQLPLGK